MTSVAAAKQTKKTRRFKWLRRAMRKARYRLEAALFYGVIGLFRLAGLERASSVGAGLMRFVGPKTKVHTRAVSRLRKAMPEVSAPDAEDIIHGVWDKLGRTTAEYAFLGDLSSLGADPRVEIVGMDIVRKAAAAGKGGLFFSGHFFNWELMPKALHEVGLPGVGVYRPANNPHINDWLVHERRTKTGLPPVSKNDAGARGIVNALRRGEFVAMLIDQKIKEGVPVPFFCRPAMTTPAPARLALKFGCPILPAWIERTGPARYRCTVFEPIDCTPTGNQASDILTISERMNDFLEQRIREKPDQWLWLHDRWGGVPKDLR